MPPLLCPFFTCDQMASLMSSLVWNMVTLSVYFHVGLFFFLLILKSQENSVILK